MGQVRWSEEAVTWLQDIRDFIALDSPESAARVIAGIVERAEYLERYPEMGYVFRKFPPYDIRVLLYGHYRIAYRVLVEEHVEILGIFHGSIDPDRYL